MVKKYTLNPYSQCNFGLEIGRFCKLKYKTYNERKGWSTVHLAKRTPRGQFGWIKKGQATFLPVPLAMCEVPP